MASSSQLDDTANLELQVEDETTSPRPKRRRNLLLCEHCGCCVSKSTYYRHRQAYFNPVSGQWQREAEGSDSTVLPTQDPGAHWNMAPTSNYNSGEGPEGS